MGEPVADLLFACASPRSNGWSAQSFGDAADWHTLLEAAEFHGLIPLLYWFVARDASTVVPEGIVRRLYQGYLDSAKRSLFLTANLKDLLSRFDAARIPVIPLKGPPLAESLYPDPALRSSFDLDLLIRPADLATSLLLMAQHGCVLAPHLARLPQRTLFELDCEVLLNHPNGLRVDLHWNIATADYPFRFDYEVLWRSRCIRRWQNQEIADLTPGCLMLYLCVHGAKHAWSHLSWLADVAALIDRAVSWEQTLALAGETRCERPVLLGALLAHDLLDAPVPGAVVEQARADRAVVSGALSAKRRWSHLPPADETIFGRTAFNARLARDTQDRVRHWAAMFKCPKDVDLEQWNLPRSLFLLYYPLRIGRLFMKYADRLR